MNVGVAPSVVPLLTLWPTQSANAPDFGGIAEAFDSPLQTIRDDFGTARVDRVFSKQDMLTGVYTVDDSADVTPTSANLYSTDVESLREQVASLEETHVFSPKLLNSARVGYSRAAYFYTGEPTPGTPAAACQWICRGQAGRHGCSGRKCRSQPCSAGEPGRQQHRQRSEHRSQSLHV